MPELKTYTQAAVVAVVLLSGRLFAGSPVLTSLYSFTGASGAGPDGGMVTNSSGTLYGVTYSGGASDAGAVFELTPPATTGGDWTGTVLYSFTGGDDGGIPFGALALGANGTLYGATLYGGTSDNGTVFELTPPAAPGGAWTETVLYSFTGLTDGGNPTGSLFLDAKGALFGTATIGGASAHGVVFELTPPSATGAPWTYAVLYSFAGGSAGASPGAGLTPGTGGVFFSTTYSGGAAGAGTVFELKPPAKSAGAWTETVLYSFDGGTEGGYPDSGLIAGASGILYGVTAYSGTYGYGVVYQMTPPTVKGGAWTETALYSFKGGTKDGENPYGNLVLSGTLLIGTTYNGGSGSAGTVFELAPPATTGGAWTETLLYNFAKGTEGISPYAGLVSGLNGALYGTTFSGGTIRDGTVFDLVL